MSRSPHVCGSGCPRHARSASPESRLLRSGQWDAVHCRSGAGETTGNGESSRARSAGVSSRAPRNHGGSPGNRPGTRAGCANSVLAGELESQAKSAPCAQRTRVFPPHTVVRAAHVYFDASAGPPQGYPQRTGAERPRGRRREPRSRTRLLSRALRSVKAARIQTLWRRLKVDPLL
jgi:hypothetical protein